MYGFTIYFKIGGYINMKKIFAFALALVMVATLFVGCGTKTAYDSEKDALEKVLFADLAQIPDYDYLYYSTTTRTVYYRFSLGYKGYMCEYIRNGHTCEYVSGEIVEVIPTVRIEDTTD